MKHPIFTQQEIEQIKEIKRIHPGKTTERTINHGSNKMLFRNRADAEAYAKEVGGIIEEIKRKNNLFTVINFIQKLTKKLYIGSIGLLLIFIVSNIWSILVSLPTSVAITIVGVAILTTIASSLSDDKSDKWYRNN